MNLKLLPKIIAATLLLTGAAHSQAFYEVTGLRNGDTLNVRTGPGANFQDIGDLQPHEMIRVLAISPNGKWAQIRYRGQLSYVATRFLKRPTRPDGSSTNTGTHQVTGIAANDPDGGLVVRDGAGTQFPQIGLLRNNTVVHVISKSRDGLWSMIKHHRGVGWVGSSYLTTHQNPSNGTPPNPPRPQYGNVPAVYTVTGVAANDVLNVRAQANAGSAMVAQLAPNTPVAVLSVGPGNWARVSVGQQAGYVNMRFLTPGGGVTTVSGMPMDILCRGTEPFWTLDFDQNRTVRYSTPMQNNATVTSLQGANSTGMNGGFPYNFSAPPFSGVLNARICSDGMSDIEYPWQMVLNKPNRNGGLETVYGCCTLR